MSDQLRDPKCLKVYAFSPPPTLDMATPALEESKSFILSVVNKAGIVPKRELQVDDGKPFAGLRGKRWRTKGSESEAKKAASKAAIKSAKEEVLHVSFETTINVGIVNRAQSELELDTPNKQLYELLVRLVDVTDTAISGYYCDSYMDSVLTYFDMK
jgi:hypothetical protein